MRGLSVCGRSRYRSLRKHTGYTTERVTSFIILEVLLTTRNSDMLGHYTCYTPNGASVVDYVMVSEGIQDQVLHFKVTDFIPTLSDAHCKLEWTMSDKCVSQQKTDNIFVQPISPNFIWSEESSEKFRFALCSTEIQVNSKISIQILLNEQSFQWMVQQQSSLKFYFLQQNPL